MNTTAMPCAARSATSRWISALAPTSMPRVGSSRSRSFGLRWRASGRAAPSAGCRRTGCRRSRRGWPGGCRAPRCSWSTTSSDLRRGDPAQPAALGLQARARCSRARSGRRRCPRSCGSPRSRRCRGPARCAGCAASVGSPSTRSSPRVGAVGAVEQAGELGAAGAEQAGEPDDLARVDVEVERLDRALAPEADRLHVRAARRPARRPSASGPPRAPRAPRARGRSSSAPARPGAARRCGTRRRACRCAGPSCGR